MSMDQSYMWHSYVYHCTPMYIFTSRFALEKLCVIITIQPMACCEREVVIALYLYKNKLTVAVKCWLIFVHQSVLSL